MLPIKIPKYKRDRFTFISNLKEVTASLTYPLTLKRNGYLLSEYYTNETYEDLAALVKQRRNLLISDNGNFSRMKNIAKEFIAESDQLLEKTQNKTISLTDAKKERELLIIRIAARCQKVLLEEDKTAIINNQLKIKPDYLIALEDLTIPVLTICGLLEPIFTPVCTEVVEYQNNSITLYQKQKNGEFGNKEELAKVCKFHVLHSYDFSSAKQGASLLSSFQPEGIAISFGGAMNNRRWTTEWNLGAQIISLPEKLPEMYLATASISLGYLEGHPQDTPIHILGVGSPILIALLGYIFGKSKAVSIDSTAPFKDAYQSNLYGSRHGFIKMDMFKVAAYALIDNQPYHSNTPFYKEFEKAYPHDWSKLRSKLGVSSATNVLELSRLLKNEPDLVENYIPFFTKMRGGNDALIKHLRIARSGHNYWIIHRICESVKRYKHDQKKLGKWIEYQINKYKKNAHPKWAKTVEIVYNSFKG